MKAKLAIPAGILSMAVSSAMATDATSVDSISEVNLHEVSIVASRANAKTPIAFSDIKKSELEKLNTGVDVPYVLSMLPSVVPNSDTGLGIGYTAMRVRGTDGSRINVTANGIPINDAESHNVYWVNMPDMISSVKDVQLQRGAGTSTNGAGAFGASINMITDTPSLKPYASFDGMYGMYNTHKEALAVGTGLMGDHWMGELRLSNMGTDGYIERAKVNMWSYFGQIGYYSGSTSIRLLAFGGKQKTYQAWNYATKAEMEKFGRRYNPCGEYVDDNGNIAYYPDQNDNYIQHHFHLLGHHSFTSALSLDLGLHYTKGDGYYEQYKTERTLSEYGLQPFYVPATDENGNIVMQKVKKSDLVRLKKMDNGFGGGIFNLNFNKDAYRLILGGGLNTYSGDHFGQVSWVRNYIGKIDPFQEYYRNNGRKTDFNIYVKGDVDVTKNLTAFADLQYRHIYYSIKGLSDNFDWNTDAMQQLDILRKFNFFNPKIGLTYFPNANNKIYGSWSVAHKEPTRNNFIDCDPSREPVAERLFDYEAGYSFTNNLLSASVNLYYMDYLNQLVPTGQLSDTGNAVSENVPHSYRMGAELQFGIKPATCFEWQINATFSTNRVKDFIEYIYEDEWHNPIAIECGNTPIAFSPSVILNNAFNFNYSGFEASLQSHFVSKQYLTNANSADQVLDAYFVSNLLLGYNFKVQRIKNCRLGLVVNNIFNAKYCNNGYAGAGYKVVNGNIDIYRYAGYAAQATTNVMGTISFKF